MSSIGEFKRTWRVASLALLILALIGPWTYEVINVPAEYTCNAPYVRLEGDYCGEPIAGARIVLWLASGLFGILKGLITGETDVAGRTREFLFILLFIFPLLPMLSTPLVLWKNDSHRLNMFQLAAWGLATVLTLFWIVAAIYLPPPQLLWGAWIYAALTPVVLVMELLALRAGWKEKQKP